MKLFQTKYRIVTNPCGYGSFVIQRRYWWLPFYLKCGSTSYINIIKAKERLLEFKNPVVYKDWE